MPRALPAGMAAEIGRAAGFGSIALLDVQTVDGTQYFWTENNYAQYLTKLTGANAAYSPWLKSVGPITLSRDFTTDAGDIILQNLSGNSIDRDVSAALKNHEFEGALAILRFWLPLFADSMFEFHGYLAEQKPGEEEASFRLLQLDDIAQYNVTEEVISEICSWRFKSAQCGSTGTAVSCKKRFVDCSDATRTATERFNAILSAPPPSAVFDSPAPITTIGFGGGDGGDGRILPERF
jgi:hypothetical protein